MSGIVVGVDATAEGRAAVACALREAVLQDSRVTAVRVWADLMTGGFPLGTVLAGDPERAEQEAVRLAEETVKEAAQEVTGADGVEVEVRTLRGSPGEALVGTAHGAELLVVGTRSARLMSRALLGSVSEYALHHATCPVMAVPVPRAATSSRSRVVVGVDHTPSALAALSWAAAEAARRSAPLVPVVVREASWSRTDASSLRELEASERRCLTDAVPAGLGVTVDPQVLAGRPGPALVDACDPQDLLVVGTRGRNALAGALLGSTSTHVAEHSRCPVVVVRASS